MALPQVYPAPPYPGAVAIYSLIDPRNGETRYVGKTISPKQRYRDHLQSPKEHPHTYCARWIATLHQAGLQPLMRVLDWVEAACWEKAEHHYIALARAAGARLTNATDGGEGHTGLRPSAEVRKKLSEAHRKRWAAHPELKEQVFAKLRGRRISDEERARRSAASLLGWAKRKAASGSVPVSPAAIIPPGTRTTAPLQPAPSRQAKEPPLREPDPEAYHARRSEIARKAYQTRRERGHVLIKQDKTTAVRPKRVRSWPRRPGVAPRGSPEHKAKLKASAKGKTLSPEHRAKIGLAHKGRQFSDESRAKMSASARKRVIPPEVRQKMAASRRAYLERRKADRARGGADVSDTPTSSEAPVYEQLRLPGT